MDDMWKKRKVKKNRSVNLEVSCLKWRPPIPMPTNPQVWYAGFEFVCRWLKNRTSKNPLTYGLSIGISILTHYLICVISRIISSRSPFMTSLSGFTWSTMEIPARARQGWVRPDRQVHFFWRHFQVPCGPRFGAGHGNARISIPAFFHDDPFVAINRIIIHCRWFWLKVY